MRQSSNYRNMKDFKRYIAERMVGSRLRFLCDCTFKLDVTGTIVGYELKGQNVVYLVNTGSKVIHIDENHPGLKVQKV